MCFSLLCRPSSQFQRFLGQNWPLWLTLRQRRPADRPPHTINTDRRTLGSDAVGHSETLQAICKTAEQSVEGKFKSWATAGHINCDTLSFESKSSQSIAQWQRLSSLNHCYIPRNNTEAKASTTVNVLLLVLRGSGKLVDSIRKYSNKLVSLSFIGWLWSWQNLTFCKKNGCMNENCKGLMAFNLLCLF